MAVDKVLPPSVFYMGEGIKEKGSMLLQDKLYIDLNDEQFFKGNLTGQSKENPKTSNTSAVTFENKKATEIISFVTERIKRVFEQC